MKRIAVIPAGGKGKRFDESLPKQYHQINGKEILAFTLEIFQKCSLVDEIVIAAEKKYFKLITGIEHKYEISKLSLLVEGGNERQDSVYNAVFSLKAKKDDLIIVHDAARPLLSDKLLVRAIKSAEKYDNIMVCLKARDTIIQDIDNSAFYLNRDITYQVQTPQIFRYHTIKRALSYAKEKGFYGTDESMVVMKAGYTVEIIEGSLENFKITSKDDLILFKKIAGNKF